MSGGYESVSTVVDPEVTEETRTRRIPPYHVVVLNDEDHTFEYVIEMLIKLFAAHDSQGQGIDLGNPFSRSGDRLHDSQRKSRAEARPGSRLWSRPAPGPLQGINPLLH